MGTSVQSLPDISRSVLMPHATAADAAVLGVAIDTRNYRALLAQRAAGEQAVSGGDVTDHADVATGVAVATGNYQALLAPSVSSDDSGFDEDMAVGVAVATGNYQALLGRTGAASPTGVSDDMAVGLPVATRNYHALLASNASPTVGHSDKDFDDETVHTGVAIATRNYQALLGQSSGGTASRPVHDGINDNTVVGLAISTRNYEALLHGRDIATPAHEPVQKNQRDLPHRSQAAPSPSRHHRFSTPHHEARSPAPRYSYHNYDRTGSTTSSSVPSPVATGVAVERPRRVSNQRETETIIEDEDAVLGLPITTGNYRDMYPRRNSNPSANARQRSYSGLAGPPSERPSVGGRQSTPDYGIAARTAAGSTAGQSTDSCFDTRRTSAAVVPHKGWLYIQSKTMKAWKRYFAVLSGLDFRYSPEPGRASKGFGMVQSIERWDGKPWGIKLVYTSGNAVHAYCGNEKDREEWIDQVHKSLDKLQNSNGQSRTTYTLAADQHEGYLYKQDRSSKRWVLTFFTLRHDGYIQCRDDANSPADPRSSGYVQSVAFADVHTNALAIELVSGESVFVYTDSYDDRMLWYAAISALASANSKVLSSTRLVKSSYIQTALPNHSGWLYKPMGLFKSWKRVYCTLHGLEFGFAKDVNSPAEEVGKICGARDWDGKQHGLEVRFASGASWKLHAESYETAKHWRSVISEMCRHSDRFNIKSYLSSRRRKKMRPVFGGWLTTHKGSTRVRRFYVADGNMLGVADDVDNLLQPIGKVVDLGATRNTTNGMLMTFADGSQLKISGDSVESAKAWYDCISASL